MSTGRTLDLLRRLLALLLLATAVVGVPMGLWQLGDRFLPDGLPSWAQVTAVLNGPDTGVVFMGLLVVIGWAAWTLFAISVAVELVAQLRGLPPLRLPGLGGPQQMAGLLVAAVLGTGTVPMLAAPALAGSAVVAELPIEEPGPVPAPAPDSPPAAPATAGPTYTVQPRDTLGRIAARCLGDWTRFEEILDLNRGRPQPDGGALTDPGLIRPGWALVLPADATLSAAEPNADRVTVQPGDTLTEIAEEHGLDSWRPIFDLNEGEPLPGGGRFTDPDLIRPGQVLDLPSAPAPLPPSDSQPPAGDKPPASPPANGGGPPASAEPLPSGSATPGMTPGISSDSPASARPAHADGDNRADESPTGLMAVLAASGALLAAGLGAAWLAHRRQRLRRRRTGRRLMPVPAELSATETAVTSAAAAGRADYGALDRALRELSVLISQDPDGHLPDVVAARLGGERLELRLHTPSDRRPPAPWTVDETGEWWSLTFSEDTGVDANVARARLAPYPTLVTIGNDRARHWLLDLERVGVLRVTGVAERREDFARHLAAELAVNSWSDLLTVSTVGFGDELVDLAPERVHPVDDPRVLDLQSTLRQVAEQHRRRDVLEGRLRAMAGDGWMPHVVLAPHEPDDGGELSELTDALSGRECRGSIAVVVGADSREARDEWVLTLTDMGSLLLPALGLRLSAPRLTEQEARDIAALLGFERGSTDEPIPAAEGDRPWQVHTDAGGALHPEVVPSRADKPVVQAPGPLSDREPPRSATAVAGEGAARADAAPDADEDGHALRSRPPGLRKRIEDDLEQLDRDLADWWSPHCARPRLTLLGPVTLHAHGDERAVAKSGLRRRYEEVVAYLATRPHGATIDEAATALQPVRGGKTDPVSARAYVHRVTAGARAWLGVDATTEEKHLGSGHRGRYTLTNVLVDADLFRQLRARAGVRGSDGTADLLAALELVSGPPFDQRPSGYEWLNGLDLTLTAAICDVAHQVVTSALASNDLDAARAASATGLRVAPDDEQVLLDAMLVAYRQGNRAEAETYVARIVEVHDGEDEMDLPMSTAETINRARRQHLERAS
jgi:DNA-binding SARP family transcriptional activator